MDGKGENRPQGFLRQAWLVIVLAVAYGAALAGVQTTLAKRIAENRRAEVFAAVPELVAGASPEKTMELQVEGSDGRRHRVLQALAEDGTPCGWVVPAAGQGFVDRIEVLVGLDTRAEKITGLYVLDQRETPGLGSRIAGQTFREQFAGKPAVKLHVVRGQPTDQTEIRALSGATISSESVARIVNQALDAVREPLRARAGGPAAPQVPASADRQEK